MGVADYTRATAYHRSHHNVTKATFIREDSITHFTVWLRFINVGYYTILYYTILYYTILYYTILYYTILYYTILYLTIIPRARVGYEIIDSQRGAKRRVGYNHLISNKREWNNCFIVFVLVILRTKKLTT